MITARIVQTFLELRDHEQANHLSRFFKTGEGQYGAGDKFLGVRVPQTRSVVKNFRDQVDMDDCVTLTRSEWHEIRLAGLLLLIELYRKAKKHKDFRQMSAIVGKYVESLDHGNNWDLVDLVAPALLGDWLVTHPDERTILDRLSQPDETLWRQRVAIVSTLALIKNGMYDDTFRLAERYLTHRHDLIHKATGWMLREAAKRGAHERLCDFLDRHAPHMPRTMLRYAIERFPQDLRQHYMKLRQSAFDIGQN